MTFVVSRSENYFHSIKSALVIEARAAEGGYACDCYLS
jgi:hypothetical protein